MGRYLYGDLVPAVQKSSQPGGVIGAFSWVIAVSGVVFSQADRLILGVSLGASETILGHGTINGRVAADVGSTIQAQDGNLTLGDANSTTGFVTHGEILTNANTVTLNDANQAVLGSLTLLGSGTTSGTLIAANGAVVDFGGNVVGFGTLSMMEVGSDDVTSVAL